MSYRSFSGPLIFLKLNLYSSVMEFDKTHSRRMDAWSLCLTEGLTLSCLESPFFRKISSASLLFFEGIQRPEFFVHKIKSQIKNQYLLFAN